jgi:hypothetical protein
VSDVYYIFPLPSRHPEDIYSSKVLEMYRGLQKFCTGGLKEMYRGPQRNVQGASEVPKSSSAKSHHTHLTLGTY